VETARKAVRREEDHILREGDATMGAKEREGESKGKNQNTLLSDKCGIPELEKLPVSHFGQEHYLC
jgi:hypothetical protein